MRLFRRKPRLDDYTVQEIKERAATVRDDIEAGKRSLHSMFVEQDYWPIPPKGAAEPLPEDLDPSQQG